MALNAENTIAANAALQGFLKGLNSPHVGDRLATIVGTSPLIAANPFPMFVNNLFVQLATAFADQQSNNVVRLVIARVLSECQKELPLVFSVNNIVENILVVATSNDPEARALTLQALESIAPIAKDHKRVHHVIAEELNSRHESEFRAACRAMAAYAANSTDFCDTVVEQLSEMLLSSTLAVRRKRQLIPVIGEMKARLETTQAAFALGTRLLTGDLLQTELVPLLLDALTELAISTRFSIPEQLSMLLGEIHRREEPSALSLYALSQLKRLAPHAHLWEACHLQKLREVRIVCEGSASCLLAFLDVLVLLSGRSLPAHVPFFKEMVDELSHLHAAPGLDVRIRFLELSVNVFCASAGATSPAHSALLLTAIVSTLPTHLDDRQAKKLYVTCARFLQSCGSNDVVYEVVSLICTLPPTHPSLPNLVFLAAQLTDTIPSMVPTVSAWAKKLIGDQKNISRVDVTTLSFVILSNANPITHIENRWKMDALTEYKVARLAFRTGHWRDVALPLLEDIERKHLSIMSSSWIEALIYLAQGHPSEFSIDALQEAEEALRQAETIVKLGGLVALAFVCDNSSPRASVITTLTPAHLCYSLPSRLCNGSHGPAVLFASRFISALLATNTIYTFVVRGLGDFVHLSQQFSSPAAALRIRNLLESILPYVRVASDAWSWLSRLLFTADVRSRDLISQLAAIVHIIYYGISSLVSLDQPPPVSIPALSSPSTSLLRVRNVNAWAAKQMDQLIQAPNKGQHRISELLSISPGGGGSDVQALASQPQPLRVDGVFDFSHKPNIQSVTVTASVKFPANPANDFVRQQTVVPHDEKYFSAPFLIQFAQSAVVHFCVEFVDGELGETWRSEAAGTVKVNVQE